MITKNLQVTHSKKDKFSLSSKDIETYIKFFKKKKLRKL